MHPLDFFWPDRDETDQLMTVARPEIYFAASLRDLARFFRECSRSALAVSTMGEASSKLATRILRAGRKGLPSRRSILLLLGS
jgi:hypothetical protein